MTAYATVTHFAWLPVYLSVSLRICLLVCLSVPSFAHLPLRLSIYKNAYISKSIRARAIKFWNNIRRCCYVSKCLLEYYHAHIIWYYSNCKHYFKTKHKILKCTILISTHMIAKLIFGWTDTKKSFMQLNSKVLYSRNLNVDILSYSMLSSKLRYIDKAHCFDYSSATYSCNTSHLVLVEIWIVIYALWDSLWN